VTPTRRGKRRKAYTPEETQDQTSAERRAWPRPASRPVPGLTFSIVLAKRLKWVFNITGLLDLQGECYFSLNEVGTRIWQLLQCDSSVGEALDALSDEYDVSREQLESDVGELLDRLKEAGLLTLAA